MYIHVMKGGHLVSLVLVCMYVYVVYGREGWGLSMLVGWVPFFTLSAIIYKCSVLHTCIFHVHGTHDLLEVSCSIQTFSVLQCW